MVTAEITNSPDSLSMLGDAATMLEAQMVYAELLECFKEVGNLASNELFDDKSVKANQMRAMILGLTSTSQATYEDLWKARLQYDVTFGRVEYDFVRGKIVKPTETNKGNTNLDLVVTKLSESLDVILKLRHPLQRDMFVCGIKGINKTVVRALHNISKFKRTSIEFQDVLLDYDTRIKLIDECVLRSQQQQQAYPKKRKKNKVTEEDAQWAYSKVVVLTPSDTIRDIIDLKDTTLNNIFTQLDDLMSLGYLDVQTGATKLESIPNDGTKIDVRKSTITVQHDSSDPSSAFAYQSFQVGVIDNPISPVFKAKYIAALDTLFFTQGRGGKKAARIRNASTTGEEASIVIGGRDVYGGNHASPIEQEIVAIANHIAGHQRKFIEDKLCPKGYIVTFHCNLLHTVVSSIKDAVYGAHSDYSALLCSDESNYLHYSEDLCLPKQDEMQIMTLVLSNSKEEYSTELKYSTTTPGGRVSQHSIKLGSCCLHFQGAGSQAPGILHESKLIPGIRFDGSIWRCICTMRFTLDPQTSHDLVRRRIAIDCLHKKNVPVITDYNITRALSSCCQYAASNDDDSSESETTSFGQHQTYVPSKPTKKKRYCAVDTQEQQPTKKIRLCTVDTQEQTETEKVSCTFVDLSSTANRDLYTVIPPHEYDSLDIHQTGQTIRLAGTIAQELAAAPMLKLLFDKRYLVHIKTNQKSDRTIPLIHEIPILGDNGSTSMQFPIPGQHYNLCNISADAGLNHNWRKHPIISNDDNTHRVLVITQDYKNDPQEFNTFLTVVDEWYNNPDPKFCLFRPEFTGKLTLYGSGGSPEQVGSHSPNASISSKDDDTQVVLPNCQSMKNYINKALADLASYKGVVTIYVNEAYFLRGKKEKDTEDAKIDVVDDSTTHKRKRLPKREDPSLVKCLGTFFCSRLVIDNMTEEDVILKHQHDSRERQMLSRYKLVPHVEATFLPFMSNEDLQLMKEQQQRSFRDEFKIVTIPYDSKEHVAMEINFGDGPMVASLNPTKRLFHRDVLRGFINRGGLHKYMSEEDIARETRDKDCDLENDEDDDSNVVAGDVSGAGHNSDNDADNDGAKDNVSGDGSVSGHNRGSHNSADNNQGTKGNAQDHGSEDWGSVDNNASNNQGSEGNGDGSGSGHNSAGDGSVKDNVVGDSAGDGSVSAHNSADNNHSSKGNGSQDHGSEDQGSVDNSADNNHCSGGNGSQDHGSDHPGSDEGGSDHNSADNSSDSSWHHDEDDEEDFSDDEELDEMLYESTFDNDDDSHTNELDSDSTMNRRPMIATLPDLFRAVFINSYCGALRSTKTACIVTKDGKEYAQPLMDEALPSLFRKHSLPMPNRALDVVTVGQRKAAYEAGLLKEDVGGGNLRVKYKKDIHHDLLLDTLLRSLILRFTGRLSRFRLYAIHKNKQCLLPSLSDMDDFLDFMKSTVPIQSNTGSLGQWMSRQHKGSIPKTTQNYMGFKLFINNVRLHLRTTLSKMLQSNGTGEEHGERRAAIKELEKMLLLCANNDHTGQLLFMAQLVVADVEELFDDPFGKVTTKGTVAGHGGKEGHTMLKNAGGSKKLEDAINDIIHHVCNVLSDNELMILGYEKDKTNNVVNKVNRRPFNATCAEHTLCKLWMIAKLTLAHYNSRYPNPTKPHCHPVKMPNGENIFCTEIQSTMNEIVAAFKTLRVHLQIPAFCLMKKELLQAM